MSAPTKTRFPRRLCEEVATIGGTPHLCGERRNHAGPHIGSLYAWIPGRTFSLHTIAIFINTEGLPELHYSRQERPERFIVIPVRDIPHARREIRRIFATERVF